MQLQHHIHAQTNRTGHVLQRRDFLRWVSTAGLAAGALSWTDAIAAAAETLQKQDMACVLLWMGGGPSQFETFSPKPDHANGGETKAISTSVPGIQIAENLPHCAKVMDDLAIIRSMTSKEGNHQRASFLLHHGYLPMGGVKLPTLGANVAHQIGDPSNQLPSFVRIGNRARNAGNAGFLGVDFDPLVVRKADRKPENTKPTTNTERYERRLALLNRMQTNFASTEGSSVVADHQKLVNKSSQMILSPKMKAFDLDQESSSMRDAYGRTQFGSGCLLARRLIESGVSFVEVSAGNWDTHQDNFNKVRELTEQIDRPFAQLITDLKDRGRLDRTLIVWMGEFGRTPKINARGGRDHYPRAFNAVLAGGGISGGQVIGKTDAGGTKVIERPVTVNDLFQSIYHTLGINAEHANMSLIGRPIKLVDGGSPVKELFG